MPPDVSELKRAIEAERYPECAGRLAEILRAVVEEGHGRRQWAMERAEAAVRAVREAGWLRAGTSCNPSGNSCKSEEDE